MASLKLIADARLVDVQRDGKRRLYIVSPDGLEVLERFLAELWPAGLRRLNKAVEGNRGSCSLPRLDLRRRHPRPGVEYFIRPDARVRWMGDRAVLDPHPGGEFTLFFDDRCVRGRYLEIDRLRRLVISWGRGGSREMPPFSSTLEVSFVPEGAGTRVSIVHRGLPGSEAPRHALDWTHYLRRLQILGSDQEPEAQRTPPVLTAGADD